MAHILIMPRQGNTVESCIVVCWKKNEGDTVQADTPVCEVETDKATFEVPAGSPGVILKILHQEGDDVPVLQPLAVIGEKGEDWKSVPGVLEPSGEKLDTVKNAVTEQKTEDGQDKDAGTVPPFFSKGVSGKEGAGISPRARNRAYKENLDITAIQGTGPDGRIIEADIIAAAGLRPPLTVAAKDAARTLGAGFPQTGSGIGGRVTLDDMAKFSAVKSAPLVAACADGEYEETPIRGIRKVIADKMRQSLASSAQFTLNASAVAVKLQQIRSRYKESRDEFGVKGITINDLVLFTVSRVLLRYPFMNAHKTDSVIRTFKTVHLGVAVDTERGLMVPVIRGAEKLSLKQISTQAKDLAQACINGTIRPEQLTGSTLTVTNLGNTGIESFTPVINIPEVAILGVCSILPKLSAKADGTYEVLPHIPFSLTIDHSVVDGAPAAKFLAAFCEAIENVDVLLAQ